MLRPKCQDRIIGKGASLPLTVDPFITIILSSLLSQTTSLLLDLPNMAGETQTEGDLSRSSSSTLSGDALNQEIMDETQFVPIVNHNSTFSRIRNSLSRTRTSGESVGHPSLKETRDPDLDINLPYRTLSVERANLDEYRVEVPSGEIEGPVEPEAVTRRSTHPEEVGERRYKLVTFTPNDPDNPKNWSKGFKWWCTMVVATTCFVVACSSAIITIDIQGVADQFNVSFEVGLLTITFFVMGFGIGPMMFAPLSEIYGRRVI